jgi:hypothetical protein
MRGYAFMEAIRLAGGLAVFLNFVCDSSAIKLTADVKHRGFREFELFIV